MEEQVLQVKDLLEQLEGKFKITNEQTNKLFYLHNLFFPNTPEYSKSCGGCRLRVYNRLKRWYNENYNTI